MRRRLAALVLTAGLVLAACGDDGAPGEVSAGGAGQATDESPDSDSPDSEGPDSDSPDSEGPDSDSPDDEGSASEEPPADDTSDSDRDDAAQEDDVSPQYQPTVSHDEILSPEPAAIVEIVEIDDTTLGVRFEGAAEPCARARVTVDEDDDTIEVGLETGLHPNAAAMSCIAAVVSYEIPVSLEAPIGDREVVAVVPTPVGDDGEDGKSGDEPGTEPGEESVDDYLGLTESDAVARARSEGRALRVEYRDGEHFALTMDFDPTRVNISVEKGIVVGARTG